MEYVHIPTGVRVTSDVALPTALYKPVEAAEKSKRATSRKKPTAKE
jgi:hypothetical protein